MIISEKYSLVFREKRILNVLASSRIFISHDQEYEILFISIFPDFFFFQAEKSNI